LEESAGQAGHMGKIKLRPANAGKEIYKGELFERAPPPPPPKPTTVKGKQALRGSPRALRAGVK